MTTAAVTSKGQITIPAEVRKDLGLKTGDRVAVLAPSGVDYIVGLFAAWYARTVAVPLFTPSRVPRLIATIWY